MNVQEFDTALSDLETRVDRLRALYENWFRGYEKMEPSVARKDVERRVYGLRKELPRNTALRFRYHQVYQRYTTLATYWQRTARQIEEGTYRLQLQRMKRRRPDDDDARTIAPRARAGEDGDSLAPPSYELSLDETLDVRQLLDDIDLDQVARAIDVPGPHGAGAAPGSASAAPVRTTGRFGRPSYEPGAPDAPLASKRPPAGEGSGASEPTPSIVVPASDGAAAARGNGGQGTRPSILSPRAEEPRPSLRSPRAEEPGAATLADPLRPEVANNNGTPAKSAQTFAKPAALKVPPMAPPAMLKPGAAAAFPSPSTGTGARIIPPAPPPTGSGTGTHAVPPRPPPPPVPGTSGAPARPPAPPPAGLPGAAPRPSLARPSLANPQLAPGAPPAQPESRPQQPSLSPPGARPPQQPSLSPPAAARAPQPSSPGPAERTPPPSSANPVARPAQPSPPLARPAQPTAAPAANTAARPPAPASPRPSMSSASASGSAGADALGEQRMRRLYDEYAAARKKNNEGDVRYETLASSIQKMLPDLNKKHQGKQIDFEVVLKDGRVGLKPKAT